MYAAFDVRVEDVPDPKLLEQTDALVAVKVAGICGSDLWPYKTMESSETGRRMGHEFIGVVQDVGTDVSTMKPGDLVLSPFLWSDGTCVFCREGLHSSCMNGGRYGFDDVDGGQGEAVRVPQADGTLVVLPVDFDDRRMPSLLTLTDVMCTGHHAARAAHVIDRDQQRRTATVGEKLNDGKRDRALLWRKPIGLLQQQRRRERPTLRHRQPLQPFRQHRTQQISERGKRERRLGARRTTRENRETPVSRLRHRRLEQRRLPDPRLTIQHKSLRHGPPSQEKVSQHRDLDLTADNMLADPRSPRSVHGTPT
jgi:Alcohol dehydrogenase GroES-like domain